METTRKVRGAHRQNEPVLRGSGAPFMCHAQRRSCSTGMAHRARVGSLFAIARLMPGIL